MLDRSWRVPRDLAEALRRRVALRAQFRCEYCLYPENRSGFSHQVDHIVSLKHGGDSAFENLAYCCIFCNRFKGSDVARIDAETGEAIRLFHPRLDQWPDHFYISEGMIETLTREGEVTARVLRFNQAERVVERMILQISGQRSR